MIAAGAVGVGVGVYVLNVEGSTDAGIQSGAQVSAGTSGAVTVRSAYGENILGIAIAGTAGVVAPRPQAIIAAALNTRRLRPGISASCCVRRAPRT